MEDREHDTQLKMKVRETRIKEQEQRRTKDCAGENNPGKAKRKETPVN